ncbi:MAG: ABC transporter ATP-binding protein [Clostridia bacterium]|nr:ABC transporter ATP-binding protein [Clostridia bacterium]
MMEVRHLSKSFGSKQVLRDLSFQWAEGETLCLMAPSGSGKTTLMRILLGLEKKDAGEVVGLEGRRIGAVFQEDRLVEEMDPVSNIRLVNPQVPRVAVIAAMARMGLEGCAGQKVRELSGGMKRRVALLRALLSDCEVLIMDEPFKGLDEETREAVIRETIHLSSGKTVLLITHDRAEAEQMGGRIITL